MPLHPTKPPILPTTPKEENEEELQKAVTEQTKESSVNDEK